MSVGERRCPDAVHGVELWVNGVCVVVLLDGADGNGVLSNVQHVQRAAVFPIITRCVPAAKLRIGVLGRGSVPVRRFIIVVYTASVCVVRHADADRVCVVEQLPGRVVLVWQLFTSRKFRGIHSPVHACVHDIWLLQCTIRVLVAEQHAEGDVSVAVQQQHELCGDSVRVVRRGVVVVVKFFHGVRLRLPEHLRRVVIVLHTAGTRLWFHEWLESADVHLVGVVHVRAVYVRQLQHGQWFHGGDHVGVACAVTQPCCYTHTVSCERLLQELERVRW